MDDCVHVCMYACVCVCVCIIDNEKSWQKHNQKFKQIKIWKSCLCQGFLFNHLKLKLLHFIYSETFLEFWFHSKLVSQYFLLLFFPHLISHALSLLIFPSPISLKRFFVFKCSMLASLALNKCSENSHFEYYFSEKMCNISTLCSEWKLQLLWGSVCLLYYFITLFKHIFFTCDCFGCLPTVPHVRTHTSASE